MVDIFKQALKATPLSLRIIEMPLERAEREIEEEHIDGIIGVTSKDAPNLVLNDEPLGVRRFVLFTRESDPWTLNSLKSLENRIIILNKGFSYGELSASLEQMRDSKIEVIYIKGENTFSRKFKMLELGRVDTVIEDDLVFNHFSVIEGLPDIFRQAGILTTETLHIGFSKKLAESALLSDLITRTAREMKQSGELQKMLNDYGLGRVTKLLDEEP